MKSFLLFCRVITLFVIICVMSDFTRGECQATALGHIFAEVVEITSISSELKTDFSISSVVGMTTVSELGTMTVSEGSTSASVFEIVLNAPKKNIAKIDILAKSVRANISSTIIHITNLTKLLSDSISSGIADTYKISVVYN